MPSRHDRLRDITRSGAQAVLVLAVGLVAVGTTDRTTASETEKPNGEPTDAVIGHPASVAMTPDEAQLVGNRASAQLIVSATETNGNRRDITRLLDWSSQNPEVAQVDQNGRVTPVSNGQTVIVAQRGSVEATAVVHVQGMEQQPYPVSFDNEVVPAFSKAGCNMGACHGTPSGKGGFRLSLRGYLPDQDYKVLTHGIGGRRINPFDPETSMILRKPLGKLPHEGGKRLVRGDVPFTILRDWIATGAPDSPDSPDAVSLELLPGDRTLHEPARSQQMIARVHYADGSVRDMTGLCYYESSHPEIAEIDEDGLVTFQKRGEAAIVAHYQDLVETVRLTHLVEVPGFAETEVPQDNLVDRAVFAKLNQMRIAPSQQARDEVFIRRVYLDTIGVLPTPEEVESFLNDPSPNRRETVINNLLERPEFADFWALKFADVLRSNSRLISSKGAYAFHRWIKQRLEAETPMDTLVRQLITANGSTFSNPEANYYRISSSPDAAVETTAQLFLGVRIQCAKCHNHPFERWTQDDYYGFAAFFARVNQKEGLLPDEQVVFASGSGEVRQPRTGQVMPPKALGGPKLTEDDQSRRERLADWMTSADNPFFAKSLVNRVWYHLMGKGIVDPVDDFRDSNPPSNEPLLNDLSEEFKTSGYDLKHLIRTILTSRTYQLSAQTNELNAEDERYFSHAYSKLLPAEVLLDSITRVTDVPTKFSGLPKGARATQLPDSQIDDPFLKTFGRPARELACECERERDSNLSQALQLIGGETVHNKLRSDDGRMRRLADSDKSAEQITKDLYQVALSRQPTAEELSAAVQHLESAPDRRKAVEDLGWALINAKEFLFRH